MKAGVVVDTWKVPIFTRHLQQNGYTWEDHPGVTSDTRLLTVKTENRHALEIVLRTANSEAAMTGKHQ